MIELFMYALLIGSVFNKAFSVFVDICQVHEKSGYGMWLAQNVGASQTEGGKTQWQAASMRGSTAPPPDTESQITDVVILMAYRVSLEIMADILEVCNEPQTKTRVMGRCELSWNMLQRYLSQLQSLGLLKLQDDLRKYETTRKGRQFLAKWRELVEFLLFDLQRNRLNNPVLSSIWHNLTKDERRTWTTTRRIDHIKSG